MPNMCHMSELPETFEYDQSIENDDKDWGDILIITTESHTYQFTI